MPDIRDFYGSTERGAIRNRRRRRQLVDMRRLRWGNITPTDIDLLIDYHDNSFVFAELKYLEANMEYGQKTAFVRNVDRIERSGARAVLLIATHTIEDPADDVPADLCIVRSRYEKRQWCPVDGSPTLLAVIDEFLGYGQPVETYQPIARSRPVQDSGLPTMADPAYAKQVLEYLHRAGDVREPGEDG